MGGSGSKVLDFPPFFDNCQMKAKIIVCQKSGCLKRGGKKLCQALEET